MLKRLYGISVIGKHTLIPTPIDTLLGPLLSPLPKTVNQFYYKREFFMTYKTNIQGRFYDDNY